VDGGIVFHLSVNVSAQDIAGWDPERIKLLFDGLEMVQRAADINVVTNLAEPQEKA
jgi:hypothetical protein